MRDHPVDDPIYAPGTLYSQVAADRVAKTLALIDARRPGAILDVGFYPGTLGTIIRDHGYGGRLDGLGLLNGRTAAEFSPTYQAIHDQELDPFYGSVGVEDLGKEYDLILALEIVEHLIDPRPLYRLIRRNLAPGGIALMSTPNVSSLGAIGRLIKGRSNYEALGRSVMAFQNDWRAHVRLYDRAELIELGRMHGLEVVEHAYYTSSALRHEARKGVNWMLRNLASALMPRYREDQVILYRPI